MSIHNIQYTYNYVITIHLYIYLLTVLVTRNRANCNLIGHVGCYDYMVTYM